MSIAKISVETFDGKEQILYDFDKSQGLDENVKTICRKVGLPESRVYGLKYLPTKSNEKQHYISENNFEEIKHNDCLKVVFSVEYIIERIVKNIYEENLDLKSIVFEDIRKHSLDSVFIDKLAESGKDEVLLKVFVEEHLSSEEQLPLLQTIVHLFSRFYITDTSKDILQKALNILKNSDTSNEEIRFTLSLLQKILTNTNEAFQQWRERILREVTITELNPYTWRKSSKALQYSALLLINTIIKMSDKERKQQLIKEMNLKKTRENIYNDIIMEGNLDRNMEHELYVLQTYLLSLFTPALKSKVCLDNNMFFKREDFELCPEDMRRITILMDFDEANAQNHAYMSLENLAFNINSSRISFASSVCSDESGRASSKRNSSRCYSETEENSISTLTFEALKHYKNLHPRNYYQSQIEEKLYEPGIFVTSERVVKMLAKMLHIGVDPPDSKSTFYQPVVFYCSSKTPFFLELFSRTMWLLSRTRREMKASTYADYEKVMHILQKQVKVALKNKPKNFKSLTEEMSATSFKAVMEKIQLDKEEELKVLMDTHPCIQQLKEEFKKENKVKVLHQRVNVLLNGGHFPRVLEKKVQGNIFVQLTKNLKELLVSNVADVKSSGKRHPAETYNIADITHVVIGKNCQHSSLCHNPSLAFSIIVNHEEKIKFIAKDERTACYWTDALLLMINEGRGDKLSRYYNSELNDLVVMDIRLQLLDLQNVTIPKSAPPIPPPPEVLRPELPPKPKPKRQSRIK